MSSIDEALAFLDTLEPGDDVNITEIAKKFGCSRSTLSRRYRGVTAAPAFRYEMQRNLNTQQEKTLVEYIDGLCARGLPPSRQMIRNFAREIAHKDVGKEWVSRFLKRHHFDLVSKWSMGLDHNRARADSAEKYTLYFELMRKKFEQYEVEPQHTYNMDEKGFLIGVLSKMKRIFSRQRYEEGGIKQLIQDGNREWITTIAAVCADGTSLSPGLIYQATTGAIQDVWLQDYDPKAQKCFFASSPSGWTNDSLGFCWLVDIFDRETKRKAGRNYRLLILDGHGSHITMKFIDYCDRHRILLAIFPPHATHSLQPLDVCIFRPLSQAYSHELAQFMDESQGFTSITKRDFFRLFWRAWGASLTPPNVLSGFEATGLHPFNPQRVISKFVKRDQDRPSSSSSIDGVIPSDDWKRISKLLNNVVIDSHDKKAQQLSNTMHAMSTENMLLKMQNTGLKSRLINEKKRRKRGKPLLLDFDTHEEGGAIFYSPNKVQRARELQAEKDATAEAGRHQKELEKNRKEAEKAEKARLVEERKVARIDAKEMKIRQQEEKQRQKEIEIQEKQANQQLQNELESRARKPKKPLQRQKKDDDRANKDVGAVVDEEVVIQQNTRGRQIRLPGRFRPITS